MKTLDGYELTDGESCWVSIQDPMGLAHLSPKPRKATYRDLAAQDAGYDFTVHIRSDALPTECEIVAVWKNKPQWEGKPEEKK